MLRIWDLAWSNQLRIHILDDSIFIVNWLYGKWEINNRMFRIMVQKAQNKLDRTDIRLVGDHLEMFQHIYRGWNQEADHLTH